MSGEGGSISVGDLRFSAVDSLPLGHDFCFVVGGREFQSYRFLACLISPAITSMLRADASIDRFDLGDSCDPDVFKSVLGVLSGKPLELETRSVGPVLRIALKLKSESIVNKCLVNMASCMSVGNVFHVMREVSDAGLATGFCTEFIAKNFEEISGAQMELHKLDLRILEEIVSNESLNIPSESWLVSWIGKMVDEHGPKYRKLLDYVKFDTLKKSEAIEILENMDESTITADVVMRLRTLFLDYFRRTEAAEESVMTPIFTKEYTSCNGLAGVFSELARMTGGNPAKTGSIAMEVPCRSECAGDLLEYGMLLNHHWKNDGHSGDNYIIFDLRNYVLKMSAYTIRACYCVKYHCRPKRWRMCGSNDKLSWRDLDGGPTDSPGELAPRMNDEVYAMVTVPITSSETYRYFRFEQLENWEGRFVNNVHLSAIEFFGAVFSSQS